MRQTGNQARALAQRGHEVVIVTRRLKASWPRREEMDGLVVERLGPATDSNFGKTQALAAVGGWLLLHRRSISVVQIVMDPDYAASVAMARLLGRTVLTWATRGDPTRALQTNSGGLGSTKALLRRVMLRRCAHVALTPEMAREIEAVGLRCTATIPVPVDLGVFRPPTPLERSDARRRLGVGDEVVVAFSGHLELRKGPERLLEAFRRLVAGGRPGRLLLIGAGRGQDQDCESQIRTTVRTAGLEPLVTLTGAVDDVVPYLWAADLFVLPSFREGMPNSLVEAMACGLPCVAPASAGGDELLFGRAGLVPPDNSPSSLLHALSELADDPALRHDLGEAAVSRVSAFALPRVAGAYEDLYRRLRLLV